jgi:cytochrome c biogenesis factor
MVAVGAAVGLVTTSLTQGLAVYLALAALIQVAVVALTVAGTRAPSYITEGRLTKTGSGLLHLGFILFALCVVALQQSPYMMPVFWAASVTTMVGTTLSFYARKFTGHDDSASPGPPGPRDEDAEEAEDDGGAAEPENDGGMAGTLEESGNVRLAED